MDIQQELVNILDQTLGQGINVGKERLYFCPFKDCDHYKPKLSVNFEKNVWKCWICNRFGSDVGSIVKYFGNKQSKDLWNSLTSSEKLSNFEEEFHDKITEKLVSKTKKEIISLPQEFQYMEKIWKTNHSATKYLKARGIVLKDVRQWKIGFCETGEYEGRIIIPSFDIRGNINFFLGRSYYKNPFRDYMNAHVPIKDVLFNSIYIDWDKPIILVEGIFDAIKAGSNAIPILSKTMSRDGKLFRTIANMTPTIYLALDEEAFKETEMIAKNLASYGCTTYIVDLGGNKDAGSMTKEEFLEKKNKAKLFSFENIFSNFLTNKFSWSKTNAEEVYPNSSHI